MKLNFEENRKLIENEFVNAKWDETSGLPPEKISSAVCQMLQESTDSMPILRAKMYAYILDNAQIEINPHTPFSAKINIGIEYGGFASQDFVQSKIYRAVLDRVRKTYLSDEDYFKQCNMASSGLGFACTDF